MKAIFKMISLAAAAALTMCILPGCGSNGGEGAGNGAPKGSAEVLRVGSLRKAQSRFC